MGNARGAARCSGRSQWQRISPPRAGVVWLGLLVATAVARAAQASDAQCPPSLDVDQRAAPPAGWSVAEVAGPRPLASVTFFDGPPEQLASLKYDERAAAEKGWIASWHFRDNPRGYWIACGYEGTTVQLTRRLPATTSSCHVTYHRRATTAEGLPVIVRIDCR